MQRSRLRPVIPVIDVLVKPSVPYAELERNADRLPIGALQVAVASIDDLIRLETGAGRTKDLVDIEALLELEADKAG